MKFYFHTHRSLSVPTQRWYELIIHRSSWLDVANTLLQFVAFRQYNLHLQYGYVNDM